MAKPELGEKRICENCGAKFYDLNRDPIVCPKCATVFEVAQPQAEKPAPVKEAKKVETPADDEDEDEVATTGPEIVSLEEADEDEGDTVDGDDTDIADVAIETDDDDAADDDTFLATDDDDDDDVSDIIAVPGDEDET